MEAHVKFTAVFEAVPEGGYAAYVEEIPGANTQGEILEEARENLREALELVLKARRELAEEQQASRAVIRESIQLATA